MKSPPYQKPIDHYITTHLITVHSTCDKEIISLVDYLHDSKIFYTSQKILNFFTLTKNKDFYSYNSIVFSKILQVIDKLKNNF